MSLAAKNIGFESIELLDPKDFATMKKHCLHCAMVSFPTIEGHDGVKIGPILKGWNRIEHHESFAHYHTGGVPGRAEIDETQELNYPAIIKAIQETGYTGHLGQEFIPQAPRQARLAQTRRADLLGGVNSRQH